MCTTNHFSCDSVSSSTCIDPCACQLDLSTSTLSDDARAMLDTRKICIRTPRELGVEVCCIARALLARAKATMTGDDYDLYVRAIGERQEAIEASSDSIGERYGLSLHGLGKSEWGSEDNRIKKSGGICDYVARWNGNVIYVAYYSADLTRRLQPVYWEGKLDGFRTVCRYDKPIQDATIRQSLRESALVRLGFSCTKIGSSYKPISEIASSYIPYDQAMPDRGMTYDERGIKPSLDAREIPLERWDALAPWECPDTYRDEARELSSQAERKKEEKKKEKEKGKELSDQGINKITI